MSGMFLPAEVLVTEQVKPIEQNFAVELKTWVFLIDNQSWNNKQIDPSLSSGEMPEYSIKADLFQRRDNSQRATFIKAKAAALQTHFAVTNTITNVTLWASDES